MFRKLLISLCLFLFVSSFVFAEEQTKIQADDYHKQGRLLIDSGEYDKALELFEKSLKIRLNILDKNDLDISHSYNNIGWIWSKKGQYEKALEYDNKALEIRLHSSNKNPYYLAVSYFNIAKVLSKKGEYDKTIEFYQKAIELDSKDSSIYFNMGNTYFKKKEYKKAIQAYQRIIELDPNNIKAYFNIATVFLNQNEYDKAIKVYKKVIVLDPKDSSTYNNLGVIYNTKHEYDKALEYYYKAIESNPNNVQAYFNLGDFYFNKKMNAKALKTYKKILKIRNVEHQGIDKEKWNIFEKIGDIIYIKEEYQKALEYYNKAYKLKGEDININLAYKNIGDFFFEQYKFSKAVNFYEKSLETGLKRLKEDSLEMATIYFNLGKAYTEKGKYNKALDFHSKALNIRLNKLGKYNEKIASSFYQMGYIYGFKQNFDVSKYFLDQALEIRLGILPKNDLTIAESYKGIALTLNYHGISLIERKKEHYNALLYHQKALNIRKKIFGEKHIDTAESYRYICYEKASLQNFKEALAFCKKALDIELIILDKKHPRIAKIYFTTGYALRIKEEYDKALDYFQLALTIQLDRLEYDHIDIANTYYEITRVQAAQGKYRKAIKSLAQVIGIYNVRSEGDENPNQLNFVANMLLVLAYGWHILIGFILFLGLIIWYFKKFRNKIIRKLRKDSKKLYLFTDKELNITQKKLGKKKWKKLLIELDFTEERFNRMLEFYKEFNIEIFAKHLNIKYIKKDDNYHQLNSFHSTVPIKNFSLLLSKDSAEFMKDKYLTGERIFVISKEEYQDDIAQLAHKKTNNIIAPTRAALTELLLSSKPNELMTQILLKCLSVKYLSPYTTAGGIVEENQFFGRTEIIKNITNNQHRNYLVTGARQLGKTSILKALERHYNDISYVECYYLSLEHDKIVRALSKALDLEKETTLEMLEDEIKNREKRIVFLIDEADYFVEMENSILISSLFRKLSQESEATFVLTGFWKLYESISMNYHSPLKNFGEVIYLGKLETEACKELMIKPMKRIGVEYANEQIVERLIKRCGNRPNLIAIVCDFLLRELDGNVIDQKDIDRGLDSDEITTKINEWESLGTNNEENRLNRLIVYLSFNQESFTLTDIVKTIEEKKVTIALEAIKNSLKQLVLAYILEKNKGTYSYRIPLLKERLLEDMGTIDTEIDEILRAY